MTGLEIVVAYLIAWGVRKAKRAGRQLNADVDLAIDAGLDRLHDVVVAKLSDDPAISKLEVEAETGEVSDRTRRRVIDAVAEAAEEDPDFGSQLEAMVADLDEAGARSIVAAVGAGSVAVGGNNDIRADGGSVAGVVIGNVSLGSGDPREPGR